MNNKYLTWKTLSGVACAALMLAFMSQPRSVMAQAGDSAEVSDQDKAVHYSLYYEDFKNENFESALPNLRWIIAHAPGYPRNNDRNFERLKDAYAGLAKQATDPSLKKAYLDSALAVFDTAPATMKEQGIEFDELIWTINKGRFIQNNPELQDRINEVPEIYRKAYQIDPSRVEPYYLQVIIRDYVSKDQKQEAVDFMDEIEPRVAEDADMMNFITEVRNSLFRTPAERLAFLETRLQKEPDNLDIVAELFDLYIKESQRAKAHELGQKLLTMDPSVRTYQLLAKMHLEDGEFQEALDLYEKALKMPDAESRARDIYFNMGIAQSQMGRLSNARTYFRRALEKDPNFGQALIAIGDLYATAVQQCGSTLGREDRAVYWLVVDTYERAKAVDPSVAGQANSKINTYRRYFPTAEDMFFMNWKAGTSYRIDYGCYSWIGETTTMKNP